MVCEFHKNEHFYVCVLGTRFHEVQIIVGVSDPF